MLNRSSILSSAECKEFMSSIKRKPQENTSHVLTNCVIDCAVVNEQLVIYELQGMFNSTISKKAFLASMGHGVFDKVLYVYLKSGAASLSIVTHRDQKIFKDDYKKFMLEKIPVKVPEDIFNKLNTDDENTLVLFDNTGDIMADKYMRLLVESNFHHYWMGSYARLNINQSIIYSKHIQRLVMSESELAPLFVFIENKDVYHEEDMESIKSSLAVSDADLVIIKANLGRLGEGNKILKVKDLLFFLNSTSFKQHKYIQDSVILIEQVKNEKVDGVYHTHRYASGLLPNNQFVCMDVYDEKHTEVDSHINPTATWLNQLITDTEQGDQIKKLLTTIHQLDCFDLIHKLLSSNEATRILLAVDFMSRNKNFLFSYSLHENAEKDDCDEIWYFCLNIPEPILESFRIIINDDNQKESVRMKVKNLVSKILTAYDEELEFSSGVDKTNKDVIMQLENILAPTQEKEVVVEKYIALNSSQFPLFFSKPKNEEVILTDATYISGKKPGNA